MRFLSNSNKNTLLWDALLFIEKKFSDIPENSDILIATPQIFDDYIRKIPLGKSVDLKNVRQDLAKKLSFGTDFLLKMRKEEGIS